MISHLDRTLEELLRREVPLPSENYDISFDIPTKDWASRLSRIKQTVNLYLYDLRENRELRTNEWKLKRNPDGTVDQEKPPMRIALSYMVSAWSPADVSPATVPAMDEHHLLSRILATLFKYPLIPSDLLWGDLAMIEPVPEIPTQVAQPDGFNDQGPGQFWNAVDQFWKPTIHYVVTIPLDLQEVISDTMVTTRIAEYGFVTSSYILSIHPAIGEDIPKGTTLSGVDIDEAAPVVRPDAALKDDDRITVNSTAGLNADDILMIVDGSRTEFCRIGATSETLISLSTPLLFDHENGTEIKRLGQSAALDVGLAAVGSAKSSELLVAGNDIRKLRVGGMIRTANQGGIEYFQIIGISGPEIGPGSSETIVQIGGVVTNSADVPAPIIGAKVILSDSGGAPVGETFSDSEGRFTFKRIVKGEYIINVSAQGYKEEEKTLEGITLVTTEDLIIKLESTQP